MLKVTTQELLELEQIREDVIILKNKSLRAVLMVSALNFDLKSDDEQKAILYQFQDFLNSLDFSCQILIESRRLNIIGYLDKLKELEHKEENNLLRIQIAEYHKFINSLLAGGQIMQKLFYLIVPFSLIEVKTPGLLRKKQKLFTVTEENFQRAKTQLWQRVEFVALGLRRCGLQAVPLNTLELIELFWSFYHPLEAERGYYPEIPPELVR